MTVACSTEQDETQRAQADYTERAILAKCRLRQPHIAIREDGGIHPSSPPRSPLSIRPNPSSTPLRIGAFEGVPDRRCYRDPRSANRSARPSPSSQAARTAPTQYTGNFRPARMEIAVPSAAPGTETLKAAKDDFDHIRALVGLPDGDDSDGLARSPIPTTGRSPARSPCPGPEPVPHDADPSGDTWKINTPSAHANGPGRGVRGPNRAPVWGTNPRSER